MGRMTQRKKPATTTPDLASLHEEWGTPDVEDDTTGGGEEVRPLASEEQRVEDVAIVVAAWHADTTATGFLHRGGMCGCRYLARLSLDAAAPVMPDGEGEEDGGDATA